MSAGRDDVANEELQQTAAASHAAELSADTRSALEARYELRQLLGRGSSAVVFLALDRVRDALVAIKMLHDELTPAASTTRFMREVEIGRRLHHTNIVPVYEAGFAGSRAYYTMQYVEGESLRDCLVRERQLGIDEAVNITAQIASALDYAHARGVIHRDVKPANVLLTADGVRVADFGIARAIVVTPGESFTDSGFTVGTPEYMSPEQAAGQRDLDGRSDIYALACVVYQMLAGEPPFTGPTAQAIIARHFQEAPRSLRVIRPSVPIAMQSAIERALAKVPADRFGTATAFVDALTALPVSDAVAAATAYVQPASNPTASTVSQQTSSATDEVASRQRRARKSRAIAVMGISLACLLLAGFAIGRKMLSDAGTTSFRSRSAYAAGQQQLASGNFLLADSSFRQAMAADSGNRRAIIWSAMVRWWLSPNTLPSHAAMIGAAQTDAAHGALSELDTMLLIGLTAISDNHQNESCRSWSKDGTTDARRYVLYYSRGTCLRRDSLVIPDSNTKSGWKFRSSYEEALREYRKAFDLQPNLLAGFGAGMLRELQDMFRTKSNRQSDGHARSNTVEVFGAFPELDHDTLFYIPYHAKALQAMAIPADYALALQHQQHQLLFVASTWKDAAPGNPQAAILRATALDLLVEAAAPEAFRDAKELAENETDRLNIATEEVMVRIKHAIPDDTASLRSATLVIDSLLRAHPPSQHEALRTLGALASLVGRASLAAKYAAAGGVGGATGPITGIGPALLTYASLGGPTDSVQKFEALVESALRALPEQQRESARNQWLSRAAALAYPEYTMQALRSAENTHGTVIEVTAAAMTNDASKVQQLLLEFDSMRARMRPSDLTTDGLYTENQALKSVGLLQRAVARIDPTLDGLRFVGTAQLGQIPETGALVRTIALRATLAHALNDRVAAKKWATVVAILWRNSDPFLQDKVREVEAFVR